jgi:hypothetical protein
MSKRLHELLGEDVEPRRTKSGRLSKASYRESIDIANDYDEHALDTLNHAAERLGFKSIFDAALAASKRQSSEDKKDMKAFSQSGDLAELIGNFPGYEVGNINLWLK